MDYIMNGMKYFQTWKKEEKFCTIWKSKRELNYKCKNRAPKALLFLLIYLSRIYLLSMYHIISSAKNSECMKVSRKMNSRTLSKLHVLRTRILTAMIDQRMNIRATKTLIKYCKAATQHREMGS